MKTIGMLGGMSWGSTVSYYQAINQGIKSTLGGLHSAKIVLYSVDFDEIEQLQRQNSWEQAGEILAAAAVNIEASGADFLLICTNTMHKVAPQIAAKITIPLLHIADATAQQLVADHMSKVGLIGTRFTMEQAFYKDRISEQFGIEVIVPNEINRVMIHDVIFNQLCVGIIDQDAKARYLAVIADLAAQGAQAIILGCTEIALLVQQSDTVIPLYDTTEIHAAAAVKLALE